MIIVIKVIMMIIIMIIIIIIITINRRVSTHYLPYGWDHFVPKCLIYLSNIHLFYINNQNLNNRPENLQFMKQFLNNLPERTKDENWTTHCENRLKLFFCIGNLREMLTFGHLSSKVCITYSRCPCNKLWRRLKYLNI